MEKNKRQEIILDIIENKIIVTQDDLQNELNLRGIVATQSTVSRDIKELRLLKALDASGTYRYINPRVSSNKLEKSLFESSVAIPADSFNLLIFIF